MEHGLTEEVFRVVCGRESCSETAVRRLCCSVLHWLHLAQGEKGCAAAYIARHDAIEGAVPPVREVYDFSAVVRAKLLHIGWCIQSRMPDADVRLPQYLGERLLADIVTLTNEQACMRKLRGPLAVEADTAEARAAVADAYSPSPPPHAEFRRVNGHLVMALFDDDAEKRWELPYKWFRADDAWAALVQ